ncbi:hydantoinase B/oxoprolinase family protein [Halobacterium sp. KA-6]|uniref:hydantoinase B/oxoprolinase family protein n=1 Tax=Halobacterium sp. KA-6 TaxID=2896368 RepID=UPI001E32F232|nr:hydantoinase B/oxoprolinase family protein [Halobacterium sp. KA-6]MCD2205214.1 hydantoinase B/oxoprolinase family protein [Halobacterium sp. KA-6]
MPDSGELEIFRHSLKSIVEEMGVTLQRTAYSTNIKIRRDHTCALFDSQLRHISQHDIAPQHIGSLVSVVPKNVPDWKDGLSPGDGILINDPYKGAVHLPDVMLISPLFHEDEIIGYAANSAHHVDIGGGTPGGIPNDNTELFGEGIIIPGVRAVEDWEYDENVLGMILRNVREPEMRRGDYQAQLGANRTGEKRFSDLYEDYGKEQLEEYLDALLDYTERRVRAAIEGLPNGSFSASDMLDGDGIIDEPVRLELSVSIDGDEMVIDFSGTAEENEGPLNCTPAMAFAGVMSVVMAFIGEDLPKNDGFYRPFEIITPKGTMVNPTYNRPVAGGWEIPMRAGDLMTKAMSEPVPEKTIGATKGIVCNTAYGGTDPRDNEEYVYYETVAGGYGGRAEKDGMDAVQTHFQNTANSPIEELETELPVRVRDYSLIQDSEGAGRQRGGLGVRRDLEFYDHEASFSLLTERTKSEPWGVFGGHSARPSRFYRNPESDGKEPLASKSTTKLEPDDIVSIQTPGGGGYGNPLERDPNEVLEDVRNGKVSKKKARTEYGVEIQNDRVDYEETNERRAELAEKSLEHGGDVK